jgi:hypothetical protein
MRRGAAAAGESRIPAIPTSASIKHKLQARRMSMCL